MPPARSTLVPGPRFRYSTLWPISAVSRASTCHPCTSPRSSRRCGAAASTSGAQAPSWAGAPPPGSRAAWHRHTRAFATTPGSRESGELRHHVRTYPHHLRVTLEHALIPRGGEQRLDLGKLVLGVGRDDDHLRLEVVHIRLDLAVLTEQYLIVVDRWRGHQHREIGERVQPRIR